MQAVKRIAALAITTGIAAGTAWTQTTVTYSYNGLPLAILPDSANVITVAQIVVPRALKTTKVTVQMQLQYPNSGDLNVFLFSPVGTRTILLEHNCSVANVDTTFDDAAPSAWKDFCPTEAGRGPFRSNEPLSNFNSDGSAFGTWRLAVENNSSDSRSGWITGFSLAITGTPQTNPAFSSDSVVNTASLSGGGTIAPGQMTSIYGVVLGPNPAVAAPSGALPTSLGGTTVTVNGTAAPIAYASAFRVDFQAPFGLSPGSTATVQVTANNQLSPSITLNVADAAPGVYTETVLGGAGPTTAVNADGSINSRLNPAAKGSVVVLYASGLGEVNPALTAGAVPPSTPLSPTAATVEALIGGTPATVDFAGAAPGFPGLYQVNVEVPQGAGSGTEEVLIFVNGKSSQKNATLEIK